MSHKKNKKKTNRKNLLINILAGFLIILSIALIFNSKIRDMFMVWNTNKYQVSQVSKEKLEENQWKLVLFQQRKSDGDWLA